MERAVIYSRVSTTEQDTENQTRVLREWAYKQDFSIDYVYEESESAWKGGRQVELARLRRDASLYRFNVVLVWSLDRLSREGSLAILKLIDSLRRYNVRVLSYQESWTNVSGELQELLYAIAGYFASFESKRRSERTKAGLERRKAAGYKLGRPNGSTDHRKRKSRRTILKEPLI